MTLKGRAGLITLSAMLALVAGCKGPPANEGTNQGAAAPVVQAPKEDATRHTPDAVDAVTAPPVPRPPVKNVVPPLNSGTSRNTPPPVANTPVQHEAKPMNKSRLDDNPIQLTMENNGHAVATPAPKRLVVTLPSNPTTGFEWSLAKLNATVVARTGNRYTPDPCPPGRVGSGGHETWEFAAVSPGTTALRLEYRRPWESEYKDPADVFETTITVTAKES